MTNSPIKHIARILSRDDNVVGLWIPTTGLGYGLFDVMEVMGEIQIKKTGEPVLERIKVNAFDLQGLLNYRPNSIMTHQELEKYVQNEQSRGS